MKLKKFKFSGLLVVLFLLSISVVFAATALTYETFTSKMEAKGYVVVRDSSGYLLAAPPGDSVAEAYGFFVYTSDEVAKTALYNVCNNVENDIDNDYDSYTALNCSQDYAGDTGMVKSTHMENGQKMYRVVSRVENTIMIGASYDYNEEQVNSVMEDLGYYDTSLGLIVFIVIGVFGLIFVGVIVMVIVLVTRKPKQPPQTQMYYGNNQNMYQGYQNVPNNQNVNQGYQNPQQTFNNQPNNFNPTQNNQ